MTEHATATGTHGNGEWPHETFRERLPEYATTLVLGGPGERSAPDIAAHVAGCATCRDELEELLALTHAAYAGEIAPATTYPVPDLSFLPRSTPMFVPEVSPPRREWWIDEARRLVVQFSQALLDLLRPPTLAGATRGRLLYHYTQAPGTVADLDLTIEVFLEGSDPALARVSVCVEASGRDPLDQAGAVVTLHAVGLSRSGVTDETGGVDFATVPLAALPDLRVTVQLGRSDRD